MRFAVAGTARYRIRQLLVFGALLAVGCVCLLAQASPGVPSSRSISSDNNSISSAQNELRTGSELTRQGLFKQAIPHLLSAREQGEPTFASEFNLALCYVGTGQFAKAINILNDLQRSNPANSHIYNLLAQAYIGDGRVPQAVEALHKAAATSPQDEKMYLFVADACMESAQYAVGMDVVNLGLKNLPNSASLHYQRGMFLALLDQFDSGKPDLELAAKLGQGSEVAFLAAAQKATFEGNMTEVVEITREGIRAGHATANMFTMLGEALVRSGAVPGQPEFSEAVASLEKSLALQPENTTTNIALGKLYLMDNRVQDAIVRLETARQLDPSKTAVYSVLAKAYRRNGEHAKAQQMLSMLSKVNEEQAEKIRSAPGERKSSYLGSRSQQ